MILLFIFAGSYAVFTLALWLTWLRLPVFSRSAVPAPPPTTRLTVIVPVRNEAASIEALLHDLSQQTYRNFEVIVADDASTDETAHLVRQYAPTASFPLQLLSLAEAGVASPKKRAISQSIEQATGHLIVTTDGDCRVEPGWLATYAAFYEETHAKLMFGPVTFTTHSTVFDALQTVEFASLIGSGACTLAWGKPTMCNGANLCYEKSVFGTVGGFSGFDQLASGDDEFLMHKIATAYPGRVQFLKSPAAIVTTAPHRSWRVFYNQRKRWASKWRAYNSLLPSVLAVLVFCWNMTPVVAVLSWLLDGINGNTALLVVGLKLVPEWLFLRQVLHFLRKQPALSFIPLTQILYPFYVIFFGIAAQTKGYYWKDRNLT